MKYYVISNYSLNQRVKKNISLNEKTSTFSILKYY